MLAGGLCTLSQHLTTGKQKAFACMHTYLCKLAATMFQCVRILCADIACANAQSHIEDGSQQGRSCGLLHTSRYAHTVCLNKIYVVFLEAA